MADKCSFGNPRLSYRRRDADPPKSGDKQLITTSSRRPSKEVAEMSMPEMAPVLYGPASPFRREIEYI